MLPRQPSAFLVAGNVVYDVLVRPVSELHWNSTTFVESIGQQLGGNGSNTSFALARLGAPARLVAWVGNDLFGGQAVRKLEEAGVDLTALRRLDEPTATSVVLVHPAGARAFLQQPGISRQAFAEPLEFTPNLVGDATHFHLGNPFSLPMMRRHAAETLRRARGYGLTTSLDAAWDAMGEWNAITDPCLPYIDLLFVNEEECRRLSGEVDPERAAAHFQSRGTGDVVVKMGGEGCRIFSAGGTIALPAFPVECVDSTGAGDVFAGAYLAALSRGANHAEAGRIANAVGALSVGKLGAVTGLLGWEETLDWMRDFPTPPDAVVEI